MQPPWTSFSEEEEGFILKLKGVESRVLLTASAFRACEAAQKTVMDNTDKVRVMIVEDEVIPALSLEHHLKRQGFEVCDLMGSGEDALKRIESEQPDLVLMDVYLGKGLSGIESARIIQSRFRVPIIYMTGYADEKTVREMEETEPLGYFIKPVHLEELEQLIRKVFYAP